MLTNRYKKSKPAFVMLNIVGISLSLIGSGVLVTGSFLTLHDTFRAERPGLVQKIEIEFDYSHYWVGGMYLLSAVMAFCSGCCQSKRRLTFVTALFLLVSMALSMFAIVLDGPDWVEWKNNERRLTYWEKNAYTCLSNNDTCICDKDNSTTNTLVVSNIVDCDKIELLTIMYGILVGGYIVGQVICFGALFVMIHSFSWKNPWKAYTSYTTSYFNKGAFNAVDDVIELYKDRNRYQTMASASSSASSMPRVHYPPAWSLYSNGVSAQEQETVQY